MADLSDVSNYLEQSRPRVIAVFTGIILIVAGFWVYTNFSKSTGLENDKGDVKVEQVGSTDSSKTDGTVAGDSTSKISSSSNSAWVARDISQDSLKKETKYAVTKGDTLWEIAKGKYGSGFEWKKILEANKDKIGFLADGSQALIEVGQELVLPE